MAQDATYSNLMAYLDSYESERSPLAVPASTSTKLLPLPSSPARSSSGYIWDDPTSYNSFSSSARASMESKQNESTEKIGLELRARIKELREEIKSNKDKAKDLQAECDRLASVKAKRVERRQKQLDAQLSEQQSEQQSSLKKQEDFMTKVQVDIVALETKYNKLNDKLNSMEDDRLEQLRLAERSSQQKRQRALQQLELEEKQSIDKIVQSKLAGLKKNAADSYGPKLDDLVRKGKLELAEQTEILEGQLRALEASLASDREARVMELQTKLRQRGRLQVLKEKQELQVRVGEFKKRFANELLEVSNNAEIEKQKAVSAAERLRGQTADELSVNAQAVREYHVKTMQETLRLQSEESKEVSQQLHGERESLRRRLAEDKTKWSEACREKLAKQSASSKDRLAVQIRAEVMADKGEVLETLKAEVDKERRELKLKYEQELSRFRLESEREMSSGLSAGSLASKKLQELQRDIEALRGEHRKHKERREEVTAECDKLKAKVAQMDRQIASYEDKLDSFDEEDEVVIEDARTIELRGLSSKLRHQLVSLEKDRSLLSIEFGKEMAEAKQRHQSELARIKQKVESILANKDRELREKHNELESLKNENGRLNEELENLRDIAFNS